MFYKHFTYYLYIKTLTWGRSGSVSSQAPTPTRLFLRSFASLHQWTLIYQFVMYFKNHKCSYLEIMLFFLADKDGNSCRIVATLSVSHSPDGVTVTPSSLSLYYTLTLRAVWQHLTTPTRLFLSCFASLHQWRLICELAMY